jgi:hypothetical protein
LARVLTRFPFAVTENPPSDPPPVGLLPVEPALPDTEEAKRLYLSAEAVRQEVKTLSEELTQVVESIDAPLKPVNES